MSAALPAPSEVLPHRPPFLFLDELVSVEPGQRVHARWHITGAEPFLAGHFPGRPTLPGVLQVEALAQAGAVAVLLDDSITGRLPLFGGIDRARFRRQVVPGDVVDLHVEIGQMSARAGKGSGVASVGGAQACVAELLFVLVDA